MKTSATAYGSSKGANNQPNAVQRWAPLIGGSALALLGLTRRSKSGMVVAAAGGLLAYLGTKATTAQDTLSTGSSMIVNCTPEQAYSFWRDFENLPRFMHHLESVTVTDGRRSHWVAIGPMNTRMEWDAEIVSERQNESIVWRSLPDSDLQVNGYVDFYPAPGARGTRITARVQYRPPAGTLGHAVAKMLGKDPNFLMRQDMRRFKTLIETGEIPTIEGQTHGPRSTMIGVVRMMDRDRPIGRGVASVMEYQQRRRAS